MFFKIEQTFKLRSCRKSLNSNKERILQCFFLKMFQPKRTKK